MFQRRGRAVILAPLALLAMSPHGPAMPARATAVTSATASAGGLQLALHIPDGPYFLSEVLPVSVTLTNRSGAAIQYAGAPRQALGATVHGGARPYFPSIEVTASNRASGTGTLANGRALAETAFVVLHATGRLTITPVVHLQRSAAGGVSAVPFAGHGPTLGITVSPTIPFSAMLALRYQAHSVQVSGPAAALSHLAYQYAISCAGAPARQQGAVSSAAWIPTGPTIHEPACGAAGRQVAAWYLVVGAPGYAVASAMYCAPGAAGAQTVAGCKRPGALRASL